MLKEWESAHRKFHMQAEASLGSALSKTPPIYSPNKVNSSASTLPSDIKSLPRLQLSRPPDTSGAPTQVTAARPERSISTPRRLPTMASSSTTNGTKSPITVNSAGTQPLDASKYTPEGYPTQRRVRVWLRCPFLVPTPQWPLHPGTSPASLDLWPTTQAPMVLRQVIL